MKKIKAEEYAEWDKNIPTEEKGELFDCPEPPEDLLVDLGKSPDIIDILKGTYIYCYDKENRMTILSLQEIIGEKRVNQLEKQLKALEVIKNLPQEEKQILLNTIYTYIKSEDKYDLVKEVLL